MKINAILLYDALDESLFLYSMVFQLRGLTGNLKKDFKLLKPKLIKKNVIEYFIGEGGKKDLDSGESYKLQSVKHDFDKIIFTFKDSYKQKVDLCVKILYTTCK